MSDDDPSGRRITDRLAADRRRREELPDRVDAIEHRLGAMEAAAHGIRRAMADNKAAADGEEPIRPWHWPDLDDETAGEKADQLQEWITTVLVARYPDARLVLRGCWEAHPGAWDVLEAAWLTWLMAHRHPARTPALLGEWHAVHRPNLVVQLGELLRGCRSRCELRYPAA